MKEQCSITTLLTLRLSISLSNEKFTLVLSLILNFVMFFECCFYEVANISLSNSIFLLLVLCGSEILT